MSVIIGQWHHLLRNILAGLKPVPIPVVQVITLLNTVQHSAVKCIDSCASVRDKYLDLQWGLGATLPPILWDS